MNIIETAIIIQSELDKAAVEQATSGWMEVNEKLVKYTGGSEVKIPSLDMDGIADEIKGINTSFRMKPQAAISGAVVRALSVMALLCVVVAVVAVAVNQEALCEEQFNIVNFLFGAICILAAWFVIKRRYPKRFLIAAVLVAVGSIAVFPTLGYAILCVLAVIFLVKRFLKI